MQSVATAPATATRHQEVTSQTKATPTPHDIERASDDEENLKDFRETDPRPWLQLNADSHNAGKGPPAESGTANTQEEDLAAGTADLDLAGKPTEDEPLEALDVVETTVDPPRSNLTAASPASKVLTVKEVSTHKSTADMWIVIDNEVYDVTDFQHEHPGGAKIMTSVGGKDATKKFDKYHRRALLEQYKPTLRIGVLNLPEAMASSKRSFLKKIGESRG